MKSFVHIPRAVLESLLPHGAALQLFAWILSRAEGEARQAVVKGRKLDLAPGEVVLGERSVGHELSLTRKAVRCALELLERKTFIRRRGAHNGAQLGAHNGSVVSIVNFNAYGMLYQGEGPTIGTTNGPTMAKNGAHHGAHLGPEKVSVIEPPYMQNGAGIGPTMGPSGPAQEAGNGAEKAVNPGASLLNNININTNTSNTNKNVSSKDKNLKVYSSFSEDDAQDTEEPGTLKGRKCKISGKRATSFLLFWNAFDYKLDRAQAIDAWAQIPTLNNALVAKICSAARHYAQVERPAILARGGTPKYAQGWLNDRRWEDECQIQPEEDFSFLERFGGTA